MKTLSTHKAENLLIHLFEIPIYDSKVCFIKYETGDAYNEAVEFADKLGVDVSSYKTDEYSFAYGFTVKEKTNIGYVHFVFINNCKEYKHAYTNTLSHENYHLIHNICKHHGIEFNDEGDNEPIAYLTGYLYQLLSSF